MPKTDRWSNPICASSSSRPRGGYVLVLVLAFIASGCAPYALIEPQRTAIGDLYTVEPQLEWSATERGKIVSWTVDGFPLEAVRFVRGLDDGEPLFPGQQPGAKLPTFSMRMTPSEIAEFVADSLTRTGLQQVQTHNLRPHQFGSFEGFAFDMTFLYRNGLEAQALVVGAVAKGKLQLIIYSGTRQYYFPKYSANVERMIDSIRLR